MKAMTKILAFVLALAMLSAMSLTLHAQEVNSNVTATVIAANEPTYQITIPETLSAENIQRTTESSYYTHDFSIAVSEISFLNGKEICVRVYAEDGEFLLTNSDGNYTLAFDVFSYADTQNALASGDIFARFAEDGKQDGFIRLDRKDVQTSDTYTGNLRFAFFLADAE